MRIGSAAAHLDWTPLMAHFPLSVTQLAATSMYAIIRSGDKQFRAEPGATLRLPTIAAEVGDTVTFDQVLVASTDDGVKFGAPVLDGASVTGEVVAHVKGPKLIVFKWKRRKNYRRKKGHRQKYTEVRISGINAG
jgi:large subunit ribosomal protein L21